MQFGDRFLRLLYGSGWKDALKHAGQTAAFGINDGEFVCPLGVFLAYGNNSQVTFWQWGAAQDTTALKAQKTYKHAGSHAIAGGIIVESEDGRTRLDLTYETLLDGMWRDVLKSEAALFR